MSEKTQEHSGEPDNVRASITAAAPEWMQLEALSVIDKLMSAYERNDSLVDLVFRGKELRDLLRHQQEANTEEVQEYDEAVAEVIRTLTHIPANPSKSQLTDLLVRSYCFARSTDCVNQNEQAAAAFLAKVVLRAKKAILAPGECKAESKIFALTGERGAGKTYFLNYLTSRFHQQLNQSKCIFIRINLTKYHHLDDDVEHWFYAQATRVVMKYYDPDSFSFNPRNPRIPVHRIMSNVLQEETGSGNLLSELAEFATKFMSAQTHEIGPSMGMDLCMRIVTKVQEMGFCFLITVDGFDRLGRDAESVKRYKQLRKSVLRFLAAQSSIPGAVLVAMRRTTYVSLDHHFRTYGSERSAYEARVATPTCADVIATRIRALMHLADSDRIMSNTIEVSQRMAAVIREFNEYMKNKDCFTKIVAHAGSGTPNLRAVMQALACVFFSFATRSHKEREDYKVIESLVRARMRYPPVGYEVMLTRDDMELRLRDRSPVQRYDGVFAPLIFRIVDYHPKPKARELSDIVGSFLSQVRLLWLLATAKKRDLASAFTPFISAVRVQDQMMCVFGYQEQFTLKLIDALEHGLCITSIEDFDEDDNEVAESRRIAITEHGERLLRKYAMDPSYLFLSAMRLGVSEKFYSLRMIAAVSLATYGNQSTPLAERMKVWTEYKIVNSIFMYCMISRLVSEDKDSELRKFICSHRGRLVDELVSTLIFAPLNTSAVVEILNSIKRRAQTIVGAKS